MSTQKPDYLLATRALGIHRQSQLIGTVSSVRQALRFDAIPAFAGGVSAVYLHANYVGRQTLLDACIHAMVGRSEQECCKIAGRFGNR